MHAEARARASIAATLNATALQCSHKLLPQSTCGNYGPFRFWSGEAISYRDALVKERKRAYAGCTEAKGGGAEARKGCNALRTCMGKCPWLYDSIMIFTRAAVDGSNLAAAPPQPTAPEVQERLRAGFDMERRRLDELLEGVAALKQRLRARRNRTVGIAEQQRLEMIKLPSPLAETVS